nr:DNA repair protein XRCC3 [Helicoverpa armigera]
MILKHLLPPNIYEVIDRAGISTVRQIIILSIWDIKKCTNLSTDDVFLLKNIVADHLCPTSSTANDLKINNTIDLRLSTGCLAMDNMLKGGLQKGTITEVFGESASGKTQLALQITLNNWNSGCVFICTEDLFPTKRYEELKIHHPDFDSKIDYGKNVFVEHITEGKDLLSCVRVRLRKLLDQHDLSLIVIDSIAAPFRCESTNYVKRAEELREIAIQLTTLAKEYNLAILCINQVTASFEENTNVLPSLGLAWSNMVTTRLMLKKTLELCDTVNLSKRNPQQTTLKHETYIRELHVVFAPHLPNAMIHFIITSSGIQSLQD